MGRMTTPGAPPACWPSTQPVSAASGCAAGPARPATQFVEHLYSLFPAGTVPRKIPLNITDDRLLGGLDLAATLAAGRPVHERGILAQAHDAILVLTMAERLTPATAARLAAAWDDGAAFCMLALDEGAADEAPPAALTDRLAFTVTSFGFNSGTMPPRQAILAARRRLAAVTAPPAAIGEICTAAALLGIGSLRACLFAQRAATAHAAWRGATSLEAADLAAAIRLVLLPRATKFPQAPPPQEPAPPDATPEEARPPDQQADQQPDPLTDRLEDRVQEAAPAVLPAQLLALLAHPTGPRRTTPGSGKSGTSASYKRGRPLTARPGTLGGAARLSLLDTLRAAAPWQRLRATATPTPAPRRLLVRPADIRIKRFKEKSRSVTIFAVDASGSSALNRLAEAKGAILLLLAACYVRRDEVALVAFRGTGAEILLPPTHALARARRSLSALPGGGPTPLATGITTARLLAEAERRKGHQPLLLLLTDGGANIALNGAQGRTAAGADAIAAARTCRGLPSMVLDTSPRKQDFVRQLAAAMDGLYLPLPYADAAGLGRILAANGGLHAGRTA